MKKNTRKAPCEICGANCNSYHKQGCRWLYEPRESLKARPQGKMPFIKKVKAIINIIKI